MSPSLYALGRWCFRRRTVVATAWALVLVVAASAALGIGRGADNTFGIPGSESWTAFEQLQHTFPEVAGSSAQIIVVAPRGHRVTERPYRRAVAAEIGRLDRLRQVRLVMSPFDRRVKGLIADDRSAAILRVQLTGTIAETTTATADAIEAAGPRLRRALPAGSAVSVGGDLFAVSMPGTSPTEGIGVLLALVVLLVMFRAFVAAGMPLVTALLGVGVSMALLYAATAFTAVSSTTPAFALMLGLAVGIDYALFVISRHREELRGGVEPEEAAARATATAGSAVLFAGATVMIALLGLAVAKIPFLTTMGVAAAAAVGVAVLISVTLTPALLGLVGRRVAPARARGDAAVRASAGGFARRWVRVVTRVPQLTVVVIVAALGAATVPAFDLQYALPDAGMLPKGSEARQTYDLTTEHFGVGFNNPLIVTGTIVTSNDPVGLMRRIGADLGRMPGVDRILLATPNRSADTGIVHLVPDSGADSERTTALVNAIRARHAELKRRYGVDLSVTGHAAVAIDVSSRLSGALLPFGAVVVGLSLILLAIVFRSIAVPIKAAVGYLLSVGAALGAVSVVFMHGVGAEVLGVSKVGPVISFLPIILMGVVFGLAMDYEVFLVSRMREAYMHNGGRARRAIEDGFVGSARVVTAAGLIMVSVFAAFVPEGDVNMKPMALGMAVGIFVDAFLVRMTLVPAVMALLGDRAWWLPRRLERVLPSLDIEGVAIEREQRLAGWPAAGTAIAARALAVDDGDAPLYRDVSVAVPEGGVLIVEADDRRPASALLLTLAGRLTPDRGDLKVAGHLLPNHAGRVRRRVGLALLGQADDPVAALRAAVAARPAVVAIDGVDLVVDAASRARLAGELAEARAIGRWGRRPLTLVLATADAASLRDLVPRGFGPVVTVGLVTAAEPELMCL